MILDIILLGLLIASSNSRANGINVNGRVLFPESVSESSAEDSSPKSTASLQPTTVIKNYVSVNVQGVVSSSSVNDSATGPIDHRSSETLQELCQDGKCSLTLDPSYNISDSDINAIPVPIVPIYKGSKRVSGDNNHSNGSTEGTTSQKPGGNLIPNYDFPVVPIVKGLKGVYTTQIPFYTSRKPFYTTQSPYFTSRQPYYPPQNPYYTSRKPFYPTQNPFYTSRKTFLGTQKPCYTTQKPCCTVNHNVPNYVRFPKPHTSIRYNGPKYPHVYQPNFVQHRRPNNYNHVSPGVVNNQRNYITSNGNQNQGWVNVSPHGTRCQGRATPQDHGYPAIQCPVMTVYRNRDTVPINTPRFNIDGKLDFPKEGDKNYQELVNINIDGKLGRMEK